VAEKQISGGFPSRTRSLEPREMMRNEAKGYGEGGGGVRGRGGRASVVRECGFNGFHYEVE
jgi:hypothetical protein